MPRPSTFSVETLADDRWSTEVAERFDARARPGLAVCLATGNTVTPFYREVARRTALDDLVIFLLDEFGGLPDGDPGRCTSMIDRDLISVARGHPEVHAPDVDAPDPREAAARYGDRIAEARVDLAIVGLGSNGHIGMNEPGSTIDQGTRMVRLHPSTTTQASGYGATVPPTWGITVGMADLMDVDEVWVLVTGDHKADILNRTIHGVVDSDVPATFLTEHPNCTFFVDESAGFSGPT